MTDITMDIDTKALRQRILTLALQGKLTDQRKEDGNAQDLYNQIQEEKQKLIKEKKIKKTKKLPVIAEDEISFDIPENWMWARLGDIAYNKDGQRIPLKQADREKQKNIYDYYGASGIIDQVEDYLFDKPLLLISEDGANLLARTKPIAFIAKGKYWVNNHAHVLDGIDISFLEYLRLYINAMNLSSFITGTAQPKLTQAKLNRLVIALPPLAEQKRIADKVSALFAQLDAIDKAYDEYRELQQTMKSRLLEQAIQGKLTDQRKEDGNAQDLYNQIQEEKQRLIKEKKIKKQKKLPEIEEDEIPFDIPENWMWVKLGNVSDYGGTKLKVSPGDIDSSTWVLDMEDIEKESGKILRYKTGIHKSIKGNRAVFSKGDILYSKLRPYLKKILIAPEDGVCTTELVPFSCYGGVNHQYIVSVLKSPYVTNIVNAASYGVKMPRVGKDIMENLIIPLPPLAEQKRIVEKLDKLLPLCEA